MQILCTALQTSVSLKLFQNKELTFQKRFYTLTSHPTAHLPTHTHTRTISTTRPNTGDRPLPIQTGTQGLLLWILSFRHFIARHTWSLPRAEEGGLGC